MQSICKQVEQIHSELSKMNLADKMGYIIGKQAEINSYANQLVQNRILRGSFTPEEKTAVQQLQEIQNELNVHKADVNREIHNEIGKESLDGLKLVAPCSEDFDANKQIHFKVNQEKVCTSGFMRHKDCYRMKINAHGVYASYAKLFRLEERYEYHKGEALRLLDLKRKYPMSNIRQIARLMHKTADEVKEDIFGLHFSKNNHRCFDKMKRDIM